LPSCENIWQNKDEKIVLDSDNFMDELNFTLKCHNLDEIIKDLKNHVNIRKVAKWPVASNQLKHNDTYEKLEKLMKHDLGLLNFFSNILSELKYSRENKVEYEKQSNYQ
jgi:hypothetical protein